MSVDVIMTCYNEGEYIGPAVRSVLDQTAADRIAAIIIIDDGSEPETLAVLQEIGGWDPRIQIHYGRANGLPLNRNLASEKGRADYIAILDGDDLWAPEKLARQLALMDADAGLGLTYTGFYTFAGSNLSAALGREVRDLAQASDQTISYFMDDPPIMPSSVLMRRSAFEQAGRFDASIKVFEDTEFYLRFSRQFRMAAAREPLIYKRNRNASITSKRNALMAHHAFVAFKAASEDPKLLPLVPRRLSERARKLGNQFYYGGKIAEARGFYALAVKLAPTSPRAWASLALAALGGRVAYGVLRPRLKAHEAAFSA